MTSTTKLIAVVACMAVAVIVALKVTSNRPKAGSPFDSEDLIRITPQRVVMSPRLSTLCIKRPPAGLHAEPAEILVFANETAINYRRSHPHQHDYPIGSKFVKEKYSQSGDASPDAATVMERRTAKGDISDWEFSIVALPDMSPLKADSEVIAQVAIKATKTQATSAPIPKRR
jgi:hypothetical protein